MVKKDGSRLKARLVEPLCTAPGIGRLLPDILHASAVLAGNDLTAERPVIKIPSFWK